MLKTLHIENYALIRQTDIEFDDGFVVITGETGAGKSIILGALGLLMGQRADLQALGVADHPLKTSMCMHLDGRTDLDRHHQVSGSINDIILMPNDTLFRPEDVTLEALLEPDTTYAAISSGDLSAASGLIDTYSVILTSRNTLESVIDKAELPYSYEELKPMISAGSVNNTGVLRITTTNDSPAVATAITNALTDVVAERIVSIVEGSSVEVVDYAVVPASKSFFRKGQTYWSKRPMEVTPGPLSTMRKTW